MGVGDEAGGSVGVAVPKEGCALAGTGVGANAGEAQPIERHRMDARLIIGIIGCNVL